MHASLPLKDGKRMDASLPFKDGKRTDASFITSTEHLQLRSYRAKLSSDLCDKN